MTLEIKPKVPLVIIPSTFEPNLERVFYLRIFSRVPMQVMQLGPAKPEDYNAVPVRQFSFAALF